MEPSIVRRASSDNVYQRSATSAALVPQVQPYSEPEDEASRALCLGMSLGTILKLTVVVLLVVGIVLGLTVGNLDKHIGSLFEWLDKNRLPGIFIFVAIYSVVTGLFFPSSILTVAGGAIFGLAGIPIVWVGACVGQTAAFGLSRYLLHDIAKRWAAKYRAWEAVDAAINDQGLKIAILIRLATLVPYSVANALLPITSITFRDYTLGSAIGIIPGVCLYTLIGHLASSVVEVARGDVTSSPTVLIVSIVVSVVVLIAVVILLTRYSKKALRERLERDQLAQQNTAAPETERVDSARRLEAQGTDEACEGCAQERSALGTCTDDDAAPHVAHDVQHRIRHAPDGPYIGVGAASGQSQPGVPHVVVD